MANFLKLISNGLHEIQRTFFPDIEHEAGPIPKSLIKLGEILRVVHSQKLSLPQRGWMGRPPKSRRAIFNAFVAKATLNMPTTQFLFDRLHSDNHLRLICGFETRKGIPSESVFSRVFAEFAKTELPHRVHRALIEHACADKIIGHIKRDSTAIEAREKAEKKPQQENSSPKQAKRKGRPRKGETSPVKDPTLVEKQMQMTLEEMLKNLPTACNIGCKKNSQGFIESWKGYKLHIDTGDYGLPISAILTAASVHDSQVAIPLATMTAARVENLYDLMDSAYDVKEIKEHSIKLNHVPIIDINPRSNVELKADLEAESKAQKTLNWKPAEVTRYNERSGAERTNARLKDEFGGRTVRVRGGAKVACHLMIGILVLTADQLIRLVT